MKICDSLQESVKTWELVTTESFGEPASVCVNLCKLVKVSKKLKEFATVRDMTAYTRNEQKRQKVKGSNEKCVRYYDKRAGY